MAALFLVGADVKGIVGERSFVTCDGAHSGVGSPLDFVDLVGLGVILFVE